MRKQTNRLFSILLTLVMLLGMLPAPAQAATTYTKACEIGAVTAARWCPILWLIARSVVCHFGERRKGGK